MGEYKLTEEQQKAVALCIVKVLNMLENGLHNFSDAYIREEMLNIRRELAILEDNPNLNI